MFDAFKKTTGKPLPSINVRYIIATRKFILLTIGMSVVCVITFFTFTLPQIQSLQERREELAQNTTTLNQLQSKLSILQNVNTIGAFAQRDQVDALLPSQKPLLPLLYAIDQISAEHQVITTEFNISPGEISVASEGGKVQSSEVENKTTDSLAVGLTVVGELANVNAFLNSIDVLSPLTDVTSLSLTPFTNPQAVEIQLVEGITVFEMKVSLMTYFYTGVPRINSRQRLPDIEMFSTTLLPTISTFKEYKNPTGILNNEVLQQKQTLF